MFKTTSAIYSKTLNIADGAVTLTDTEIGFTASQITGARRARICNTAQSVRVATAIVTNTTDGMIYVANSVFIVEDTNNLINLTIRAVVDGALISIELEG